MSERTLPQHPSAKDELVSRPDQPLPSVLEPDSPEARGYPADPKGGNERSAGHPSARDSEDLGRTA